MNPAGCNFAFFGYIGLSEGVSTFRGERVGQGLSGNKLSRHVNPILAAWPPLFLGALCLATALALYCALPTVLPAALFGFGGVAFVADARARRADYRRARDRILAVAAAQSESALVRELTQLYQQHKRSWCQRTSLIWAAAAALGPRGSRFVRGAFRSHGYHWWHITPDGTFSRHCPFLKLSFWLILFGLSPQRRNA